MQNKWQLVVIVVVVVGVALFGLSLVNVGGDGDVSATTRLDAVNVDTAGYAQAIEPYNWQFPADFGPHPAFQTEWWYYTGNIETEAGRRFGYQLTIFRRAIRPEAIDTASEWRTNQIYMGHFTVSDIGAKQYFHEQRFSRGSAGLAGATIQPRYRVWVEDWQIQALNDEASLVAIQASSDNFAIDLTLAQVKPVALQGDGGLSPKSDEVGNASYYYSLPRLATRGTITVDGEAHIVAGFTWKDHEFSTSALGNGAQGWDWFGLIFDNNTELMLGQIRMVDGGVEPAFGGLIVYPDGATEYLPSDQFTITATDTWTSPHTGAVYPAGWDFVVETVRGTLRFSVTPLMSDQELVASDPSYWEGAVQVSGDVPGYGYAELTGYADTMQNRF